MKKAIGILSIVMFLVVEFDSCAVNLVNSLGGIKKVDGAAGMILGLFMLAAGIISLCSKIYSGRIIAAIIFYCLAGLIGYYNIGSYEGIKAWIILNAGFAVMLFINLIVKWNKYEYADYSIGLLESIKKINRENEENYMHK